MRARAGSESSEPTTSCREVPGDEHPLLIALLHELMPVEAHAPLLAEAARCRPAAPAGNGGFESQRLAQLRGLLIPLCWLPSHDAPSFARSNRHAPSLSRSRRACSDLVAQPASRSRQAGARTRQETVKTSVELRACLTPWARRGYLVLIVPREEVVMAAHSKTRTAIRRIRRLARRRHEAELRKARSKTSGKS